MADLELDVTGIAAGGDGVAHDAAGRVVFVPGAIPGDRVRARLVVERARYARGALEEVVDGAPGRTEPPCPHVAEGCGGCGWQHIAHATQVELKQRIVADALRRIGRLDSPPPIDPGPALAPFGYRTSVRGLVAGGRFAYRRAASHDPVDATGCLIAHPLVAELIDHGRFGAAAEVVLRAGVGTGERLAIVDPRAEGVTLPADVAVVGLEELRAGDEAAYHEVVAGRRWRISARSFFQTRPDGAAALVDVVAAAVGRAIGGTDTVADLYCGVGLLAGTVGADAATIVAVDGDRGSVADAELNLAVLDAEVTVVRADVARWRPTPADIVVADPARAGLGTEAVQRIAATGADRVVLVACDPASFGRDAGLLHAAGYRLGSATLVDLFPHTPRIEVVGAFGRHPPMPGGP
ncbi:MAG: TRAM domain-containing protein [Acidimicrobiales bacterium]